MVSYLKQNQMFQGGGVERVEQGRASEQIGLGWNEKNKDNHRRAE